MSSFYHIRSSVHDIQNNTLLCNTFSGHSILIKSLYGFEIVRKFVFFKFSTVKTIGFVEFSEDKEAIIIIITFATYRRWTSIVLSIDKYSNRTIPNFPF
jgi:hypothetical protein